VTQYIILNAGQSWVQVRSDFTAGESPPRFGLVFSPARVPAVFVQAPFAVTRLSVEVLPVELPGIPWADVEGGPGLALVQSGQGSLLIGSSWLGVPIAAGEPASTSVSCTLIPHAGDWEMGRVPFTSAEVRTPLVAISVNGRASTRPSEGSFLRISFQLGDSTYLDHESGITVIAWKAAENKEGSILRFQENFGRTGSVQLVFDRDLVFAQRVNLLEEPVDAVVVDLRSVELPVGAHEIVSVRLRFEE
jgi:hypothetical protein